MENVENVENIDEFDYTNSWLKNAGFRKDPSGVYVRSIRGKTISTMFGKPYDKYRMTFAILHENKLENSLLEANTEAEVVELFRDKMDNLAK